MKLPKKPWRDRTVSALSSVSGRRAEPTVAHDLGRHALVDLAVAGRAEEKGEVGVTVHVDETRTDDAFARVDAVAGRRGREIADRLDAPPPEADVGRVGRRTGAVHHEAADQGTVEV